MNVHFRFLLNYDFLWSANSATFDASHLYWIHWNILNQLSRVTSYAFSCAKKVTWKTNTCITNCIKACPKMILFCWQWKRNSWFVNNGNRMLSSNCDPSLCVEFTGKFKIRGKLATVDAHWRIRGNCLQTARCLLSNPSHQISRMPIFSLQFPITWSLNLVGTV